MELGPDPHSFANFKHAKTTQIDLVLNCDFEAKEFHGHVDITVDLLQDTDVVLLDISGLKIQECSEADSGKKLDYSTATQAYCGSCLEVKLPPNACTKGSQAKVRVKYNTTAQSSGIQWLSPSQTKGGDQPFCFTQCQAIQTRTVLPCQDTPSVKAPFSFTITVPSDLTAVCSGLRQGEPTPNGDGTHTFVYHQPMPVMAYLIAAAVGKLAKASLGPRSDLYAEPEILEAARWEYDGITETFIVEAEKVCGTEYKWKTYDIVMLPSSFAYGGMENPNATFLSSALLAGDKSLTTTLAHEITHSWCGNMVTNAFWKDFWLNEGFTRYVERRILGAMFGPAYRGLQMTYGYFDLIKNCNFLAHRPYLLKLQPEIVGVDPDESFSRIPYEKGSLFLHYLEGIVGGEQPMTTWLRTYFTDFAEQSVTTDDFRDHFTAHFTKAGVDMSGVAWDHWLHGVGLPDYDIYAHIDNSMTVRCKEIAHTWLHDDGNGANASDIDGMKAHQVMVILDTIINENTHFSGDKLDRMDSTYHFSETKNCEIGFRWFLLCLKNNHRSCFEGVKAYLSRNGRGVYVKPLYVELYRVDPEYAREVYGGLSDFYMDVVAEPIKKTLEL
ncbi:hypothetical protein SARC_00746 [Sphaeroforma arctica JP610]|uniref:Peptidase M1 leukotriene A4 hydrolase/aminopeptidase C-terminal domain-containing protein n=1 Tax=Sphaeroforma arctica JP610 TaxID=667725 RepID=A0A0L0GFS1_9EUKA|nr:hypothetical protein SARC_00746 [Sphaeroforma arctica JP610]KNC87123.1 hypothetical protein SARC_00746 [Sphaeroforma arctica JP610]|eukprot:XP_014161025.1 hypothetical protein SARC_00746 [Sphaeroforma arctica JP610]